jgi:hypothetical protein
MCLSTLNHSSKTAILIFAILASFLVNRAFRRYVLSQTDRVVREKSGDSVDRMSDSAINNAFFGVGG